MPLPSASRMPFDLRAMSRILLLSAPPMPGISRSITNLRMTPPSRHGRAPGRGRISRPGAGYPQTATELPRGAWSRCRLEYPDGMVLYSHPRLHSRDGEAVREFLRGKHLDFEIIGPGAAHAPVDTHINALYMPDGSYLSYVQYGAPARTKSTGAAGDYRIQFPID